MKTDEQDQQIEPLTFATLRQSLTVVIDHLQQLEIAGTGEESHQRFLTHLTQLTRWLAENPEPEQRQNRLNENGFDNRETLQIDSWLREDVFLHAYWQSKAQDIWEDSNEEDPESRLEFAMYELADAMENAITPNLIPGSDFLRTLVWSAYDQVNWQQVAERYLEEYEAEKAES